MADIYGDDYTSSGYTTYTGFGYQGYSHTSWISDKKIEKILGPLIHQIKLYDDMRLKLGREGGSRTDIQTMAEILSHELVIKGDYRKHKVALINKASIMALLRDIGFSRLRMEVRQIDDRWPVYYLCRVRQDYWSEYSLIVKDFYRSPGYPVHDDRFLKLMRAGHEVYYLRLAQFRDQLADTMAGNGNVSDDKIDDVLYNLGRHVFQAAWHEDQRPGVLASTQFDMPTFRTAIELLYLCLSGELCELRSEVTDDMKNFFQDIYPQPAIHAFLEKLADLDGSELNDIPQDALKLYAALSKAFARFLKEEVTWGYRKTRVPMYKLVFGNFSRLDLIAETLHDEKTVIKAVKTLEQTSQKIINEITEEKIPMKESA